jgi:hypothetical protein
VSPLDTLTSSLWLEIDDITVAHARDPLYPYRLINTDDHDTVTARFLRTT